MKTKTKTRLSRRVVWPALAAVAAVSCLLVGAWAMRPTVAQRCASECGQPTSLNAGTPDVSRDFCNRICAASVAEK